VSYLFITQDFTTVTVMTPPLQISAWLPYWYYRWKGIKTWKRIMVLRGIIIRTFHEKLSIWKYKWEQTYIHDQS